MTTRNNRVRFCQNNMLAASGATLTASGSKSGYAVANLVDPYRYRQWIPPGTFVITTANQKIYINDGSNFTATIAAATYTYTTLATAVAAALNAVSSNWTCTYDFGVTNKFTIGRSSGTKTLRLTQTTNAAWDQTAAAADVQRNHTSEFITFDLGVAKAPLAFMVVGPGDALFPIGSTATVTLKGNNVNSFTSPQVNVSLTAEGTGIVKWLDDLADTTLRYWQYEFTDRTNTVGPEGFGQNIAYLGDYVTPLASNVINGFVWKLVDPSTTTYSVGGTPFFRRYTKYHRFDNLNMENLTQVDRLAFQSMYSSLGQTTPLFVALDPTLAISATAGEMTKYCRFDVDPACTHVIYQTFNSGFQLREVV